MAQMTYREAVRQALREELQHDKRVFLLGEDIAEFGGSLKVTLGLLDEFGPKRIRNTPISEMALIGAAVGAAATGSRPIAEVMYSDFFGMAMDQVVNQAAKMRYMFGGKLSIRSPSVPQWAVADPLLLTTASALRPGSCTSLGLRLPCLPARTTPRGCSRRQFGIQTRRLFSKTRCSIMSKAKYPRKNIHPLGRSKHRA